jgi:histidinol-phosphate aminotransferase
MKEFDSLVPEHIREMAEYVPGKPVRSAERESGVRCIKMASNENPFGPSPRALEAMRQAAAQANFYPDNENFELRRKLAERHQVNPEQVLVTGGSTQFLDIIARTVLAPGLNALSGERSFIIYPTVVKVSGGRYITVPLRNDGFDLDALLASIDRNTRVIFIANPNNPTGTMFDAEAFHRFFEKVPERILVVLDEAYCDFAERFARQRGVEYSRSLDLIRQGTPNLIVLRTFSKAHGLAGMRVGYGLGHAKLLQYFARVRIVFSVSSMAEAAALAAMDDLEHVHKAVENNVTGAAWLTEQLERLGVRAVPTSANFIYFDLGRNEDAAAAAKGIQANGVIVRPLGAWGAPSAIRVTIGTPEQNQKFITALKAAIGSRVEVAK